MEFKPVEGIQEFIASTQRILIVSKKPDSNQYWTMVRVTALGLVVLGVIGYSIELASFLLKSGV